MKDNYGLERMIGTIVGVTGILACLCGTYISIAQEKGSFFEANKYIVQEIKKDVDDFNCSPRGLGPYD